LFELLYRFLNERPGGASTEELLQLLLPGPGRDVEFGKSFLRGLLAEDPRFFEASGEGRWRVVDGHVIDSPLESVDFVVVDVETTGQRIEETGITEIGAVKLVGGRTVARFDRLVNPGRPIPSYVAQLTGISDAMVSTAPSIHEILPEFEEFARGGVLVAHNAAFDAALLDHHARKILGRPLGLPSVCTFKLARRRLSNLEKTSLDALCEYFGLTAPHAMRHRALADAELTAAVLQRLLSLDDRPALRTVRELISAQDDPGIERTLSIRLSRTSLEGLPERAGVYRLIGDGGATLFVARADNVRQAVSRQFHGVCHLSDRQLKMLTETVDVRAIVTAGDLEARLVEAEWVRKTRPQYNRSDRHLPRGFFVRLATRGPHPRTVVTSRVGRDTELYVGPLKGRNFADDAARALARAFGLPAELHPEASPEQQAAWTDAARRMDVVLTEHGCARRAKSEPDALTSSDPDSSILGRLGKLGRGNRSWLANRPDCLVVAPAADGGGLVFCVIGGLCRRVERVRDRLELDSLIAEVRRLRNAPQRRVSALLADVSTILAHRLREKDGDGIVIPLSGLDEDPESVVVDIGALLPTEA
jgi:DNA polymerase III epsilon subunit family exonuclease